MKYRVDTVGIVGGGRMGCGIAYLLARAGFKVIVFDPQQDSLDSFKNRFQQVGQLLGDDPEQICVASLTPDIAVMASQSDFVIEAAPEKVALKQDIFAQLDEHAPSHAVLASNTSAIPIARIAERVRNKARVIGTHFWNPPALVRLVEVVQSDRDSASAVEQAMTLLNSAGWTAVHLKRDIPGFVGNRMQHALKREAIALVAAGVCDAETVDTVVKEGFGSRLGVIGPLEQSDMLGLELTRNIHQVLLPDLDITQHVQPYLVELIEAGKTGMTAGEGFRKWTPEEAQAVRDRLDRFMAQKAATERQKTSTVIKETAQ